jgi:hypothetical protein
MTNTATKNVAEIRAHLDCIQVQMMVGGLKMNPAVAETINRLCGELAKALGA